MTATVWPVGTTQNPVTYAPRYLRQAQFGPLLALGASSRPLGGVSGVRPGTGVTTVTATSTTWTCGPFAGVIDAEAAAEAGAYGFAFDANSTGAVTAANASNPRVDIIFVQVSDPAEGDGTSSPAVTVGYLAGAPAAIPAAPATPARSFVVAQINVPKTGGGTPSVAWVSPEIAGAGGVLGFATEAGLRTVTSLPLGTLARARDTGAILKWDYVPGSTTTTGWSILYNDGGWQALPGFSGNFTADNNAAFRKVGNVVYLRGQVTRKTGNIVGNEGLFTLTAGARPAQLTYFSAASASGVTLRLSLTSAGLLSVAGTPSTATAYVMLDGLSFIADL